MSECACVCDVRVMCVLTLQSHTLTVMSCWYPTETMKLLLVENATQETPYLWDWTSATWPPSTSHTRTQGMWPLWYTHTHTDWDITTASLLLHECFAKVGQSTVSSELGISMAVSLFPQSYLTSDQVLAIVGESQSTEGSPETQKQLNTSHI